MSTNSPVNLSVNPEGDWGSGQKPLCFEYEGAQYRIAFRHDRSAVWADHFGHPVRLTRDADGPTYLVCVKCGTQLSHLPKRKRVRLTRCVILSNTADPGAEPTWAPVFEGVAQTNEKAGDHFDKAEGRIHALHDALHPELGAPRPRGIVLPRLFRDAAWAAFHARLRPKAEAGCH